MKQALFSILMLILLGGCTKSQINDSLVEPVHLNGPAIATILPLSLGEGHFADCVQAELAKNISEIKFIAGDKFRDALFPWFEPSTFPKNMEDLGATMNQPLVLDRIQSIGIRFIIFVGGHKLKGEFDGPFTFVGGFGAAGAFGYISSDRKTEIKAVLWDLEKMVSLGEVEVEKSGSFKWIGLILPIPIPDVTESSACRETAERIANCLKSANSHGDKWDGALLKDSFRW